MRNDGKPIKGRGAMLQVPNRFEAITKGAFHAEGIDEPLGETAPEPTRYLPVDARNIVNPVNSPDLPFRYSMNPYQGCEHGCAYCYARPTHEYWGYSAGLDFERVILVKRGAAARLEQTLRRPGWEVQPISISGATDPYQPIERKEGLTRSLLQVALDFGQPVVIITKNALVLRDLDLLSEMASKGLASVAISLTTLDESLRRALEPRTSTTAQRLEAIRALSGAGVPVMAMLAPIIPALNEPEVSSLLKAGAAAGAISASYTVLRTNGAVEPVFRAWLEAHYPDRSARVLAQTRAVHGGAVSDSRPGRRLRGEGPFAENINRVFRVLRRRHFGERAMPTLRTDLFKPPPQGQLGLFDG
ncbi:MAG: PA0069 family radical SAM protein [Flavobacteriales bacterium]|nr:MAG: PA0069 family radical SAM protein [Flavobacteriales bacterium]